MLPKPAVPEGSRKVLNGVEVYTRHNFTTERGNFFETMNGEYILPNGKPVEDRTILESLPEPQKQEALAWWDRKAEEVMDRPSEEDLMVENEALKSQIATMQAESDPVVQKPSVTDLMAENEALKAQITSMRSVGKESLKNKKDLKGKEKDPKGSTGKTGTEKGPSVLNQMGIPA